MSEKVTGRIEKIDVTEGFKPDKSKWKRGSFEINEHRYSTFDTDMIDQFNVGDFVEAEYDYAGDKNQFRNITTMKKSEFTTGEKYIPKNQNFIIRQSSLKVAVDLLKVIAESNPEKFKGMQDTLVEKTLEIAGYFENWVLRE